MQVFLGAFAIGGVIPGFNIPFSDACGSTIPGGPHNTVETARKHRYLVQVLEPFGNGEFGILLYAYKCTRPNIEIDQVMIHNAQDEISRPGKQHWKPVEFTFYEKLQGGSSLFSQAAQLIYFWWGSTMINLETSLHNEPSQYLKNTQLDMLDGSGDSIWSYFLLDSWPSKVSPSDLSYTDSNIAEISVTLSYAKAKESS